MNRNLKLTQIFGQFYVLFVLCFIIFMYYDIMKVFKPDLFEWDKHTFQNLYFIVFNVLFFMLSWCLIRTMISDPGKIPLFWGFYFDGPEHKKRRYCLICHIFKPERCHHCSICGRCVLNMDHHCPWLNNCIGFQNRKFFFLLIFYVNVTVWYILGGFLPYIWKITGDLSNITIEDQWVIIPFCIFIPFSVIIFNFFLFHYRLITKNMTTIENLDKERNKEPMDVPSKYDIGFIYNWQQVFGQNKYLWPFPVFGESGKPVGDGVIYKYRSEGQTEQGNNVQELKDKSDVSKKTNDQFDEEQNDNDVNMQKNFIPPQYKQSNQRYSTTQLLTQENQDQRNNNIQLNGTNQGINNMKFNQTNQSVMNSTIGKNGGGVNVSQSFNNTQQSVQQFNIAKMSIDNNQFIQQQQQQQNLNSNQNTARQSQQQIQQQQYSQQQQQQQQQQYPNNPNQKSFSSFINNA